MDGHVRHNAGPGRVGGGRRSPGTEPLLAGRHWRHIPGRNDEGRRDGSPTVGVGRVVVGRFQCLSPFQST